MVAFNFGHQHPDSFVDGNRLGSIWTALHSGFHSTLVAANGLWDSAGCKTSAHLVDCLIHPSIYTRHSFIHSNYTMTSHLPYHDKPSIWSSHSLIAKQINTLPA